ncbi:MAG: hypothetical protein L0154_19975 [Chloroflexi bacterium]|nr:hypothetical protein [Chloroflexota bacterium]
MEPITISRILFIIWLLNEIFVVIRSDPEDRAAVQLSRFEMVAVMLLFVPLFIALDYPDWFGWILAIVQSIGLALEIAGEVQLSRSKSFSMTASTPEMFQTTGLYRFLENPIYVGILLQVVVWAIWMPLILVGAWAHYNLLRKMVTSERTHLAEQDFVHRGVDSFLWN